jgi:hypothetical protein
MQADAADVLAAHGMKALILLALAVLFLSTAQATEPATLTLGCEGVETRRGYSGALAEDHINIGIIVDFQKQIVNGLSDYTLGIGSVDETTISFYGITPGWNMEGRIDRVTGALVAASNKVDPNTRKLILSLEYQLQCKPTQRMF